MEGDKPTALVCTLLAIDQANLCYRVCSICERNLPDNLASVCKFCNLNAFTRGNSASKLLFRVLISIASDSKVFTVICFDRAAKGLFGCTADEFFHFAKLHPFAAVTAGNILEGEMFRVTLSKSKNGYSQHLRVVSVAPLRSDFQPVIETLREVYGVRSSGS